MHRRSVAQIYLSSPTEVRMAMLGLFKKEKEENKK